MFTLLAALFTGCGAGGLMEQQSLEADPAFLVRILPTRPGLDIAGAGTSGGAEALAPATLDKTIPELEKSAREAGLQKMAVRRWTGPDGARLVAVAGLWDDGSAASAIGGEIARAAVPGGRAWTPSGFGAAQGFRTDDARSLSVIIGKVWMFVRAEGPIDDEAVIRTIHEIAGGVPAIAVRLAEMIAMLAAADPRRALTPDDVEAIHRRLSLSAA